MQVLRPLLHRPPLRRREHSSLIHAFPSSCFSSSPCLSSPTCVPSCTPSPCARIHTPRSLRRVSSREAASVGGARSAVRRVGSRQASAGGSLNASTTRLQLFTYRRRRTYQVF
jgi:hypothetical protein